MSSERILDAIARWREVVERTRSQHRARALADAIADDVRAGRLAVGDRLPAYAEMKRLLGLGSATYQVLSEARRRGILRGQRSGARAEWGTYVAGTGGPARVADPVAQRWGVAIMSTARSKETELARVIAAEVRAGILSVGYRLPATTHLAPDLGLAHATVRCALKEALRLGVLAHRGSATTAVGATLNNLVVAGPGVAEQPAKPHPAIERWRREFCPTRTSIKSHIAVLIKQDVRAGRFDVGDRLPFAREVALALNVDRETVMLGYQIARADGLVETRKSSGTFIAEAARRLFPSLEERARFVELNTEPVQRIVSAVEAAVPAQVCAHFVFDLGDKPVKIKALASDAGPVPMRHVVAREDGITRHTAVRLQDTEEWAEKERQRRARQKPPRPPRQKFRMKNSRVWGPVLDQAIAALPAPQSATGIDTRPIEPAR